VQRLLLDPGDVGNVTVSISNFILTGGTALSQVAAASWRVGHGDDRRYHDDHQRLAEQQQRRRGSQGGGAISYAHGTLTVVDSFVNNNTATSGNGGGIDFADLLPAAAP